VNNRIVFLFVLLFTVFFFIGSTPGGDKNTISKTAVQSYNGFLQVGEELTYEVSYSFFKLGTVRIKTLNNYTKNGRPVFKTIAFIDSYNIPLVSLHNVFESEIDENVYSHQFIGSELEGKEWKYTKYELDYSANKALMERGYPSRKVIFLRDSISLDKKKFQDGLSIFFAARNLLFSQSPVNIPVLINEKKENAYIKYPCPHETAEIDAVDYPVDVLKFEGKAGFVGIMGLTGDFTGWFSNDNARIPITARMNVVLGSIYVELKSWTRPGWMPPRRP
jgi:hypothetical protein